MGLNKIWIRTLSDGLLRADQVIGLTAHATPSIPGKSPRWLLDVTIAIPAGSGNNSGWDVGILHRTLVQTPVEPVEAPEVLARLLSRLDEPDTAGIIELKATRSSDGAGAIQFDFHSFDDRRDVSSRR
ncbi:hypothetical protein [Amycolatopsis sp. NPDC052450]|uniref:hypothetical protein n=1 Tax=Amycolatopsis sp. NPDC052450 TaxID=3363937 RepID=UPI0037C75BBA